MAANDTVLNDELKVLTKRVVEAKDAASLRVALVEMTAYLDKRLADDDKASVAKAGGK